MPTGVPSGAVNTSNANALIMLLSLRRELIGICLQL
jgi:hypothetical protein